tara:strand:- start:39448 stop:39627 length:180 start_codon:yes stop_codon:yes gene_type:complete
VRTVIIADMVVQVNLGVIPLAIRTLETGSKNVAIVDTDVFGRVMESHFRMRYAEANAMY